MRRCVLPCVIGALSTVAAVALAATITGTYRGATSQHKIVVLHVANDVVRSSSKISWSASCVHHVLIGSTSLSGPLRAGRFYAHDAYRVSLGAGGYVIETATARFSVGRHRAAGTFRLTAKVYAAGGRQVDRCASPRIRLSASR